MPAEPGSRRRDYAQEPFRGVSAQKPVEPFSDWQLMVEEARAKKRLSFRRLGEKAQIPPGNLFNWTRARKGGPPRTAYTASVNLRLATQLGLNPEQLAEAYNRSAFKPLDPQEKDPDPAPRGRAPRPGLSEGSPVAPDNLQRFMDTLEATRRQSFTMQELKQFAAFFLPAD